MAPNKTRTLLRALVKAFPPLRVALAINDCICFIFNWLVESIGSVIRHLFSIVLVLVKSIFSHLLEWIYLIPYFRPKNGAYYQRITIGPHKEPLPYRNKFLKRSLTYQGSLLLGILLYVFVYFVLIKHHNYITLSVAFVALLAYLMVLENSHNIRSIVMLCLPIMFTNRGRALVFCSMLSILVTGPVKNTQFNVKELHSSLTCCKQYLIIKTDKYVDQNLVQGLARVEGTIRNFVGNIKELAKELRDKFDAIIQAALSFEAFLVESYKRLKDIVNICNNHTDQIFEGCKHGMGQAYYSCRTVYFIYMGNICDIILPTKAACESIQFPKHLCKLPKTIVNLLDKAIGKRLKQLVQMLKNEFYVDIDVTHSFSYNGTKSKSYRQVSQEIQFDVERKFWYVHFISRVFNLVSLILVVWILTTATLYHMHYLNELKYDNMYIDRYLFEIEERRKSRGKRRLVAGSKSQGRASGLVKRNEPYENIPTVRSLISIEDEDRSDLIDLASKPTSENEVAPIDRIPGTVDEKLVKDDQEDPDEEEDDAEHLIKPVTGNQLLFPMSKVHLSKYLKPFSVLMNQVEMHKMYIAGFVWIIITGYILFFVALDYLLYILINFINSILREILFKSDLPLVDIESKSGHRIVSYNRTYLAQLRNLKAAQTRQNFNATTNNSTLGNLYRKLMDSLEGSIPDDIAILDSLQECLPRAREPAYENYEILLYLAIFTFAAVVLEAYALRTRHCIANLYYPGRARKRAVWLYRKLLAEKPKYEEVNEEKVNEFPDSGVRLVPNRIKKQ